MADNFTQRALKVLDIAQDEAKRFRPDRIEPEHLLLALIAERDGVAGRVLEGMDVSLSKARLAVQLIIGHGEAAPAEEDLPHSDQMEKVLRLAAEEACRMHHYYIGTEHLLMGIVLHDGVAVGILESLGAESEKIRDEINTVVTQSPTFTRLRRSEENSELPTVTATAEDDPTNAADQALSAFTWRRKSGRGARDSSNTL